MHRTTLSSQPHKMALPLPQLILVPFLSATAIALVLFIRAKRRSLSFLQGPSSPSTLLGIEWELRRVRRLASLEAGWMKQYGTAYRLPACYGEDMLAVADPRGLQHIFHKGAYRFKKAEDIQHFSGKIFGPGIVTCQAEDHQRQRKILNPAFSAAQIRRFSSHFNTSVKSLIMKWQGELEANGGKVAEVDTTKWLPNMALDALGTSMFEYQFGALDGKESSELCDLIRDLFIDSRNPTPLKMLRSASYRFLPPFMTRIVDAFPTKEDERFAHWLNRSQAVAGELVRMKGNGDDEKDNDLMGVLSRALHATSPDRQMDTREALSQMATVIFAGHETSSSSLNWLLYELARHPEDQKKVFQEIKAIRDKVGSDEEITPRDIDSMVYLNAIIKESLRLHPIVAELFREAAVDEVIPLDYPVIDASGSVLSEIPVVKGQRILADIAGYNTLKQIWGEDAEEWNPRRFIDNKTPTTLGVFGNLMTFSGGVRSCIGWRFAVLEIQVVLVNLIETFNFEVPEGIEIEQVRAGLATPLIKGDWAKGVSMPLIIRPRETTVA
ncbi:cytochrome P450 [Marasmius fiardii PR-910]|nr:cytochrome P450 [Marasmius fiardii PR-910]